MLFNSYLFIFVFLPIAVAGYVVIWRAAPRSAAIELEKYWLIGCSAAFYGAWSVKYLALLIALTVVNYAFGRSIAALHSRWVLALAIAVNLGVLGYFKYTDFLIAQIDAVFGARVAAMTIILPLGISFFMFQKIAYLVDVYRGQVVRHTWRDFALFVFFFPQLIAGPIVHQREILPQLTRERFHPSFVNVAIGGSIFAVGLFKKVILADGVALTSTPVFAAALGTPVTFADAWIGVLSYGLQIYFDFSGYTDMAIGLARMFGVRLPVNFNSPYKAGSIIDFWRRWHITLSRFLRDYLYFPLGGSRAGVARQYLNIMIVMLLGGLWHGASWTFVLWGGLHGSFLLVNHLWRGLRGSRPRPVRGLPALGGTALTFLAVMVAWVFFRATTIGAAMNILSGLAGLNGLPMADGVAGKIAPLANPGPDALTRLIVGYVIVFALPNTQQIFARYRPDVARGGWRPLNPLASWRLDTRSALVVGSMLVLSILSLTGRSEFLYFQF